MKKVKLKLSTNLVSELALMLRHVVDGDALTGDGLIDMVALEAAEKLLGKTIIMRETKINLIQSQAYAIREIIATHYQNNNFLMMIWRSINDQLADTEHLLLASKQ